MSKKQAPSPLTNPSHSHEALTKMIGCRTSCNHFPDAYITIDFGF